MKKIIHMSDIHIGHEDLDRRFAMIVERLAMEKGDRPEDYVVVITGDLVEDANQPHQYALARELLDRLVEKGFTHLLVVPGNHDYGNGSKGDKRFVRKFMRCFYGKKISYPKLDVIDGVAFIGLDSMAAELNWYDRLFSEGQIGEEQLGRLEKMLGSRKVRACARRVLYLHHHPFAPMPFHELKDAGRLKEAVAGKVEAILYGHNHQGQVHNGCWGIPRCYDAGSATLKERSEFLSILPWFKVRASTRVIDLEQDPACGDYVLDLL